MIQNKNDFRSIKHLLQYVKPYWKKVIIGAVLILSISLLALPSPYFLKIIFDSVLPHKNRRLLCIYMIVLMIVHILRSAISLTSRYHWDVLNQNIIVKIKKELFYRILRLPLSFFDEHQSGYILSRIGEVEGLGLFFSSSILSLIINAFEFVFCLAVLFSLNTRLTLITIFILPFFFVSAKIQAKGMRKLSRETYEKGAITTKRIQDSLMGVDVIKYFGAEKAETDKINNHLVKMQKISIKRNLMTSLSSETMMFIGAIGGFVVLLISGLDIIKGSFTIGSYMAFSAYIGKLYGPTQIFANIGISFQPAKVALERVNELMGLAGEDDGKNLRAIDRIARQIEFRNVSFAYENKTVLNNLCFRINKGDKILITGPNGSGKSTIVKLLLGLYKAGKGSIFIDDIEIAEVSLSSLRQQFSIVSQNTFLFNDSIRNNILYSKPEASEEDIQQAMNLSGVNEFVYTLDNGLATEIGERGAKLSGGEKQKISIARAILRGSEFIILDEATTHLDKDSEKNINALIQNNFFDKTCIIITHRPFTFRGINKVFSIKEGRIINEVGDR